MEGFGSEGIKYLLQRCSAILSRYSNVETPLYSGYHSPKVPPVYAYKLSLYIHELCGRMQPV